MSLFCSVGGCTSSTKNKYVNYCTSCTDDEACEVCGCEKGANTRIKIDDFGTVLDGKNTRYHCLPMVPKPKNHEPTAVEKLEIARVMKRRQEWIHALGRADLLPKNIRVCSLHFPRSAYDPFALLKHGCSSFLEVPTRHLLLPNSVPTENLINKKKSIVESSARATRMDKRLNKEVATAALRESDPSDAIFTNNNLELPTPEFVDALPAEVSEEHTGFGYNQSVLNIEDHESLEQKQELDLGEKIRKLWEKNKNTLDIQNLALHKKSEDTCLTENEFIYDSFQSLFEELKAEKKKTKAFAAKSKQDNIDKERVAKMMERKNKEIHENQLEKCQLRENIEAAGGALNMKVREKIVRDALKHLFSPAQLDRMINKKQSRWSDDDYALAITFLCHSTRGYRYAREVLKLPFPAVSCVKARISNFPLAEGVATFALKIMEAQGKNMTELERVTALTFDEIHISSNMVYDSVDDKVLGPSKKVQVMMAQGVFGRWKNVVYYDYNKDVDVDILTEVITALSEAGFPVVSVTCDMGSENRTLYKNLGVSDANPSFPHPVTGGQVCCFHDSPHLIKLARNHLVDSGLTLNPNDEKNLQRHATKGPLIELISRSSLVELHPHNVLWRHVEAKQCDRQNVKLATQVLSQKTSNCLSSAAEAGELLSPDCEATAEYCLVFNKFFDIMNTMASDDPIEESPPEKQPYGRSLAEQKKVLNEIYDFVDEMRKKGSKKGAKHIFFQKGVLLNCRALPLLHDVLTAMYPDDSIFIHTWYLSQDILESLFSVIRAMGGTNISPNPLEMKYRLRRYMVQKAPDLVLHASKTNVEPCGPDNLTAQVMELVNLAVPATPQTGTIEDNLDEEHCSEMQWDDENLYIEEELEDGGISEDEDWTSSSDESEDEILPPPAKKTKKQNLERPPEDTKKHHPLYESGLQGLASIIAYKLRKKMPQYIRVDGKLPSNIPVWIEHYSCKGMSPPTDDLIQMVTEMDNAFNKIHGDSISKEKGLVKSFSDQMCIENQLYPPTLVAEFCVLRILVRVRALNKRNRNQKKEDAEKAKLDKNTRQARANKIWLS